MVSKKNKGLKRTLKFLSQCKNPKIVSQVLKESPNSVIKAICNAVLNAAQGDVILKPKQKKILSANRHHIQNLIQKGNGIVHKRRILVQRGGQIWGIILPTILSAVISAFGNKFLS